MFDCKKVSFIMSSLELRGHLPKEQEAGDYARRIIQFWTDSGELVFEYDLYTKEATVFKPDELMGFSPIKVKEIKI